MTIPVTLNTISNLQDTTTAQTTLNNNNAAITGGFSTALNVTGDQMKGNLDMNSNQILNLPAPATVNSPARLVDVVSNPTITVPSVGTSGAVVGLLNANKTDSGNNTFTGTNSFGAITATTFTSTTINATNITTTTLNVTGTSVFSGSVSLPLSAARIRSTSVVNLYVNATTGSNSNTGLSATSAFSTIGAAVNYFQANYDLAVVGIDINIAGGTYNESVILQGLDRGALADINLIGAGSATTIINAPSGACLAFKDYGVADISGLTLQGSSTAVAGISVGQFAICDLGTDIKFGSFPLVGSAHFTVSQNASVNVINNYTISGSASYHMFVSTGGLLGATSVTATMPTTLSFNTFGYFYQGARVNLGGFSATGAGVAGTTGTKFFRGDDAFVGSGGVDLNTILPGSASGVYYVANGYDYLTPVNTVTSLSNISPNEGYTAVVSDATVTTANTSVTGGGANTVLVWYNGSSWRILGS